MSRSRISRAEDLGALLTLLALVGCNQAQPHDDGSSCSASTVLERDHIEFWLFDAEQEKVCGAGFDAAVSHAYWVSEAWGSNPDAPIRYEVFASQTACWPCKSGALACGWEGRLATTRVPDHHELAHAAHGTSCTSLIEEGWATLFGRPFGGGAVVGDLEEASMGIAELGGLPQEYYSLAARFVAFVIEGWGLDAVHELCDLRLASAADLDAGLRRVLDMSLAETQLALDDYPDWTVGQLRQDRACADETVHSMPFDSTMQLGCSADGVEGVLGQAAWAHTVVDLGAGGGFALNFESDEDVEMWVEVRSCAREGLGSLRYSAHLIHAHPDLPAGILLLDVPGGRHVIRVMDPNSRPTLELGISAQPWP